MLQEGVFSSKVDDKKREGWKWDVFESKDSGEGSSWATVRTAGVRDPRAGAAVKEAAWGRIHGGYSAVRLIVCGGARKTVSEGRGQKLFCFGCYSSVLLKAIDQKSAVPRRRQRTKERWSRRSEEPKCAVWSSSESVKRGF